MKFAPLDGQAILLIADSDVQTLMNQKTVRLMGLFNLSHIRRKTTNSKANSQETNQEREDNNYPMGSDLIMCQSKL